MSIFLLSILSWRFVMCHSEPSRGIPQIKQQGTPWDQSTALPFPRDNRFYGARRDHVHRIPLKILPKMPRIPRRGRSVCTACAYLMSPIAVENCGFSTAEVKPEEVCACAK